MKRRFDRTGQAATGMLILAAGALVAGCVIRPDPIDPNSPVAAQAKAVSKAHYATPSFRNVPPQPTDVRAPAVYKSDVVNNVVARRGLERWAAANPPLTTDSTEGFAEAGRAALAPALAAQASLPSDEGTADTEAFAEVLRKRATPPPPPK